MPRLGLGLAGVALLGLLLALIAYLPAWLLGVHDQGADIARLSPQDRVKAINDLRGVFLQVLAGLGLVLSIYFTARTFLLNRQGQVNDRFTKAIEQLGQAGAEKLDVRLGGIYALEQIARDSRELHGPVVEILCAFLRQHARPGAETAAAVAPANGEGKQAGHTAAVPADLQAAITVLGRRNVAQDAAGQQLDLRGITLPSGASFEGAKLQGANFADAQLQKANFWGAQLQRANFERAQLQGANFRAAQAQAVFFVRAQLHEASFLIAQVQGARFSGAQLQGGSFRGAQVRVAEFYGAQLQGASFGGTQLHWAYFEGAQLQGVDFAGARDLTLDQLKAGEGWREAILPGYLQEAVARAESAGEVADSRPESAPGQPQTPSD